MTLHDKIFFRSDIDDTKIIKVKDVKGAVKEFIERLELVEGDRERYVSSNEALKYAKEIFGEGLIK